MKKCSRFKANKLPLNESKRQNTLFHKPTNKDNIPLKLLQVCTNQKETKITNSFKFLGALVEESVTWNNHIDLIENKRATNIGILYKTKNIGN